MQWTSEEDRAALVRMNDQLGRWLLDIITRGHRNWWAVCPPAERRNWRDVTDQDRQRSLVGAWIWLKCDPEDELFGGNVTGLVADEWSSTATGRPEMVRLAGTDTWWPASWIMRIDRRRLAVAEYCADRIMRRLRAFVRSD